MAEGDAENKRIAILMEYHKLSMVQGICFYEEPVFCLTHSLETLQTILHLQKKILWE